MKRTIRNNIKETFCLHDRRVIGFEVKEDDLIMRLQSGMTKTTVTYGQPDGHVEFGDVQWDFSYVYLLDCSGNAGPFTGEKLSLRDFIERYDPVGFCVMDETYGFNMTKYSGYLLSRGLHFECIIEIYHEGDMTFVDDTVYTGMKEVILSHDSEAVLYSVPAEVAAYLEEYCWYFASNWVWHGPENGKFLKPLGKAQLGAVFGAPDFIDYLNRWVFPDRQSRMVKALGCYDDKLPEEYRAYPKYNF